MPDFEPSESPLSQTSPMPELHGFIRLVLDRIWLIALYVAVSVIVAIAYLKGTPRVYEAQAVVEVEQEDAKVVKAEQVVSEDMRGLDTMNTVAQKLSKPALVEGVLETNRLLPKGSNDVEMVAQYAREVRASLRRNTRLIDLTVRNTDPQLAARLDNGLIERYLEQDARAQQATTENANALLREESNRLKKNLEASEQALEDYRKDASSISLQQSQDILTPQLQDLSKRLTEGKALVIKAGGAYRDSLKMSADVADLLAFPEVAADSDVVETSGELTKSENEFALICQRYRAKHPKYILAAASVEALKEQLAATALKVRTRIQESRRIAYQRSLTTEDGLQTALTDTENSALKLSASAVRFNVLTRDVESDRTLYDSVITRLGETTLAAQITPERIRVIEPATPPARPVWPKPGLILALALGGGLALGLGVSVLLAGMETSFRTPAEIEQSLALPVLGIIQKLPRARGSKNVLVAAENGNPAANEIFRTLRTTLSMLGREKNRRTFLFTSSLLSEGKTFTSVNFAVSLAQQGSRTLLVDADLRRPMIEETLSGRKNDLAGVSDYLLGSKKFNEVCRAHEHIPNLFWIGAGTVVPDAGELLARKDFQPLLDEGLAHYDRIVIDSAPLLPVSDTLHLAAKAQTVVLVVQGCKTSRYGVERSVRLLNSANARIAGVVLNLLPNRLFSGYDFSYYGGNGYNGHGKRQAKSEAVAEITRV